MENETPKGVEQGTVEKESIHPRFAGHPEFDRTPAPDTRRKPQAGLALVLPIALLGGALWLGTREPEPITNSSSVMPFSQRSATPKRLAQSPPKSPEEPSKVARLEIFMPNDNGKLDRRTVDAPGVILTREVVAQNRTALQEKLITAALRKLLKDAADFFPKGAALAGPVSLDGGYVNVDFNRAYAAGAESWSSAETTTRVMSIVNTAIATKEQVAGSESSAVRILIEGKKIDSLGPLDAGEPIEAEQVAVQTS